MKYYIISEGERLVLYKVANELIANFEIDYKDQAIASGNSMMEVLLEFEKADDSRKAGQMEAKPVKYKSTA